MSSKPQQPKKTMVTKNKRAFGTKAKKTTKPLRKQTKRKMATAASQGDIIGIDLGVCFFKLIIDKGSCS